MNRYEVSVSDDFTHCTRWAAYWDRDLPVLGFVLLHPPRGAGLYEPALDPELRACVAHARARCSPDGRRFGGVEVRFALSYMDSDPLAAFSALAENAVVDENDANSALRALAADARVVQIVIAWTYWLADCVEHLRYVLGALALAASRLYMLGYTMSGDPRSPVWVATDVPLVPYVQAAWFRL